MIGYSSGHHRGTPSDLWTRPKLYQQYRPAILPLFADSIRKPREAAKAHAKAEVGAFHNRGANALRIGTAHNWDYLHGLHFGRTVPFLSVLRVAVDLDEMGEVATVVERVPDNRFVRAKPSVMI